MLILCQGKIEEAKEYIDKADILGPAGLTLVSLLANIQLKKAIVSATNSAHHELGNLASSMNIDQIKVKNSLVNSKSNKNLGESKLKTDIGTRANSNRLNCNSDVLTL